MAGARVKAAPGVHLEAQNGRLLLLLFEWVGASNSARATHGAPDHVQVLHPRGRVVGLDSGPFALARTTCRLVVSRFVQPCWRVRTEEYASFLAEGRLLPHSGRGWMPEVSLQYLLAHAAEVTLLLVDEYGLEIEAVVYVSRSSLLGCTDNFDFSEVLNAGTRKFEAHGSLGTVALIRLPMLFFLFGQRLQSLLDSHALLIIESNGAGKLAQELFVLDQIITVLWLDFLAFILALFFHLLAQLVEALLFGFLEARFLLASLLLLFFASHLLLE